MTLLDTTVLIDALRGRPAVVAKLSERGGLFLASAVSVDEVLFGMRDAEQERTHRLIEGLEVVSVGLEEARLAAHWRRSFASQGTVLSQSDCLIAACAATRAVPFATANVRDFPMQDVTVEHWPSQD